jgi:hypothetical protein
VLSDLLAIERDLVEDALVVLSPWHARIMP